MSFTTQNTYILGLLTLAFIVGEISHFLIGVTSRDVAREIHYGQKACFANITTTFNVTEDFCNDFEEEAE